jgi:hypothetical protein
MVPTETLEDGAAMPASLLDLLETLTRRGIVNHKRYGVLKSSIRTLAKAMGVAPESLEPTPELPRTVLATLRPYVLAQGHQIATAFTQASDIRHLLRLAHAHQLLTQFDPGPPRGPRSDHWRKEVAKTSPYRTHAAGLLPRYGLPPAQWPPDVRAGWARYCEDAELRLRPPTLEGYERHLRVYVGYQTMTQAERLAALPEAVRDTYPRDRTILPPLQSWDELFSKGRAISFVRWHAARVQVPKISHQGWDTVKTLRSIALAMNRQEFFDLGKILRDFRRPPRMHDKSSAVHSFKSAELLAIGRALMDFGRLPIKPRTSPSKRPSLYRALKFRDGLLLALLAHVPLRARNICEMRFARVPGEPANLRRNGDGQWHIHFEGRELKIAERHGKTNIYDWPWPEDLLSELDEWFRRFRPILPNADVLPYVFLSGTGRRLSPLPLCAGLKHHVLVRTGKLFFTHLARTIFTDEGLDETGDLEMVAAGLGDRTWTVDKHYRERRDAMQIEKAVAWNRTRFGGGRP